MATTLLVLDLRFGDRSTWQGLELQTLDWRFRWRGPVAPGPETVLVMADDRSIAELGSWPVPRAVLALAVRRLAEAGAAVIALDLLFGEATVALRPELRALLGELAALPGLPAGARVRTQAALGEGDGDAELAAALRASDRAVIPYAFVFAAAEANRTAVPAWIAASAYRVSAVLPEALAAAPVPAGLLAPPDLLGEASRGTGHVALVLEPDGSMRAMLPALAFRGELYPSLPVEALRLRLGLDRDQVALLGSKALRLGPLRVPLDPAGRQLLDHYGPPGTLPTFSLVDLVRGRLDPAAFAGRIVLIGADAAGTGDRFATPFGARVPGTELLATAIDNMLHGRSLVRDEHTRALDLLAILLLALAAALLAGRRSPLVSAGLVLLLIAGWAALAQLTFARAGWWLAGVTPPLAAVAAGVAIEMVRLAQERRRRRGLERQRANLGRYFAPAVVERLALNDEPHALDRTHEATVMFVDLIGFTRTAETLTPAEAMALLRAFHTLALRIVFAHGGMVDKFMGDGVMACFGVPEPTPSAAADALRMAFALLAALEQPLPTGAGPPRRLRAAIGIHAGPVLMGDVGGDRQLQFTVVGDAVNVASRLETLTRSQGTCLIASDAVVAAARAGLEAELLARLEPLPSAALRGRAEPVAIWRLVEPSGTVAAPSAGA
ncbi:MAG: adenylate/guanylate cyclase domain-containing protein [Geminicoccaceae bacterium]